MASSNTEGINKRAFSQHIKRWLSDYNKQQVELAVAADIAPATLNNWLAMKSTPDLASLARLARAMGEEPLDLAAILFDVDPSDRKETTREQIASIQEQLDKIARKVNSRG